MFDGYYKRKHYFSEHPSELNLRNFHLKSGRFSEFHADLGIEKELKNGLRGC